MAMTAKRFRMEMHSVIEHVQYHMKGKEGDQELVVRYTAEALKTWNIIPYAKYDIWGVASTPIEVLKADPIIRATVVLVEADHALEPIRKLVWHALQESLAKSQSPENKGKEEEWR